MEQTRKLTKKQRKAREFREGTKKRKKTTTTINSNDKTAEEDLGSDAADGCEHHAEAAGATEAGGVTAVRSTKTVVDGGERSAKANKRRRGQVGAAGNADAAPGDSTALAKPKRRRTVTEQQAESQINETTEEGKRRYIVFVGNLPYKATKKDIEEHFTSAGKVISSRLLTDKSTGQSKGFAFVEFDNSESLNNALHFHHTLFLKRQINVELTAGGGGKSEARKARIDQKRANLEQERRKYYEKHVLPNKEGGEGKHIEKHLDRSERSDKGESPKQARKVWKSKKAVSDKLKPPSRVEGANAISLEGPNRRVFGSQSS